MKDQTQTMAVELLSLATCALQFSSCFLQQCKEHTAMAVCKLYRDPFMLAVSASLVPLKVPKYLSHSYLQLLPADTLGPQVRTTVA